MIPGEEVLMDLELFRCAQINFNNAEKMMPILKDHQIYQIAKMQLDEAIQKAESEEEKEG